MEIEREKTKDRSRTNPAPGNMCTRAKWTGRKLSVAETTNKWILDNVHFTNVERESLITISAGNKDTSTE